MGKYFTNNSIACFIVLLSMVILSAMGCGSDSGQSIVRDTSIDLGDPIDSDVDASGDTYTDIDGTDRDTDKVGRTDTSDVPPYQLEGTWAHIYHVKGAISLKLGGPQPIELGSTGASYALVTLERTGGKQGEYSAAFKYCGVFFSYNSGSLMAGGMRIPRENVDHALIEQKLFVLSEDGTFHQNEYTSLLGMDPSRFVDPENDPLPDFESESRDLRVVDLEEDGHPGLTISLFFEIPPDTFVEGDVYGVLRVISALDGWFVTPDRILGELEWHSEIAVLGFGAKGGLKDLIYGNPEATFPDPDKQKFEMVRVNDITTCSFVIANKNTLFSFKESIP